MGDSSDEAVLSFETATPSSEISKEPIKNNSVEVLGIEAHNFSKLLIGAGLILIISCGILTFLKWKKYL